MKHVYLAAPYGKESINVLHAIDMAEEIQENVSDVVVFLPHLYHYYAIFHPYHSEKHWLDIDLAWLAKCDCIYRMPGKSDGADIEVTRAIMLGLPVFHNMADLIKWSKEER